VPLRQGAHQALQGVGLGEAAFLAWLGIANAKQWVSTPALGWEQASIHAVLRSAARLSVGHLAVAWNEEMVFRGYGFETVRAALGQGKAVAVLIPGFALYPALHLSIATRSRAACRGGSRKVLRIAPPRRIKLYRISPILHRCASNSVYRMARSRYGYGCFRTVRPTCMVIGISGCGGRKMRSMRPLRYALIHGVRLEYPQSRFAPRASIVAEHYGLVFQRTQVAELRVRTP
jgi:hypothetical protein